MHNFGSIDLGFWRVLKSLNHQSLLAISALLALASNASADDKLRVMTYGAPPGFERYLDAFDTSGDVIDRSLWLYPEDANQIVVFVRDGNDVEAVPGYLQELFGKLIPIDGQQTASEVALVRGRFRSIPNARISFVLLENARQTVARLSPEVHSDDLSFFAVCTKAGQMLPKFTGIKISWAEKIKVCEELKNGRN